MFSEKTAIPISRASEPLYSISWSSKPKPPDGAVITVSFTIPVDALR